MKKVSYSTPLSLCLSGEYSAPYQKPLLVVAIEPRITFTVWKDTTVKEKQPEQYRLISQIVKNYLEKERIHFSHRSFECDFHCDSFLMESFDQSDVFMAEVVAAVASFLEFYSGKIFEKEAINSLAFEVEKKWFRHHSFGFAGSASSYGGMIYYRKEFEFLKYVSRLAFRMPKSFEESLYLIAVPKKIKSFKEMKERVNYLYNKKPRETEQIFSKMERVTRRMVVSIIKEDISLFSSCISENEQLLEALGVVPKASTKLLESLRHYGTGKTSGPNLIIFYSEKGVDLEQFLKRDRIGFIKFKQDFTGVRRLS